MLLNLSVRAAICANYNPVFSNLIGLKISGQVTKINISIPCRVRLYEKLTGRLLMETVTDENGNYSFNHLTHVEYFLVAHDPVRQYNAVIQDMVKPV